MFATWRVQASKGTVIGRVNGRAGANEARAPGGGGEELFDGGRRAQPPKYAQYLLGPAVV